LKQHQPILDFSKLSIDFKSLFCNKNCLVQQYIKAPNLNLSSCSNLVKESKNTLPNLNQKHSNLDNSCLASYINSKNTLRIRKLSENATIPTRGSPGAAGLDLYSAQDVTILPQSQKLVSTDLAIQVPKGTYGRIAPRSGLALKNFIDIGAGVLDMDYTGHVGIVIFNHSQDPFEVKKGDRIAQLIVEKIMILNP